MNCNAINVKTFIHSTWEKLQGKELEALAEGLPENLELWNFLRNKKRDQIKKLIEIAKIVFG